MPSFPGLACSYLFVPGDRPERFEKAVASGAHRVVLDLEDAVAPAAKESARAVVAAWLRDSPHARVLVRINARDTACFEPDLRMLAGTSAGLMCPKAEPESMSAALALLHADAARENVALVETVRGLLDLRATAALPGVGRIAFGSIDFALDAGLIDGVEEPGMQAARTAIVMESRYAELPAPIDGVTPALDGGEAQSAAAVARRNGFGAKLCIHPRQVADVHEAFAHSAAERAWAERVITAFEQSGGAAVSLDGKMIDLPVFERARRIATASQ